jgi:hypothetical protein
MHSQLTPRLTTVSVAAGAAVLLAAGAVIAPQTAGADEAAPITVTQPTSVRFPADIVTEVVIGDQANPHGTITVESAGTQLMEPVVVDEPTETIRIDNEDYDTRLARGDQYIEYTYRESPEAVPYQVRKQISIRGILVTSFTMRPTVKPMRYGTDTPLIGSVAPNGGWKLDGNVYVYAGQRQIAYGGGLSSGIIEGPTIPGRALEPGKHQLTYVYEDRWHEPIPLVGEVSVAKAIPKVSGKLVDPTVQRPDRPKLDVTVAVPGFPQPLGSIEVKVDGRTVQTVALTQADAGKKRIVLPAGIALGQHQVVARYVGTRFIYPGSSAASDLWIRS